MVKRLFKHLLLILSGTSLALFSLWYLITAPLWLAPEGKPVEAIVSIPNLTKHIRYLSETAPERSHDLDNLKVSASYIHKALSQHAKSVEYQNYDVWGLPYTNVIASFGNTFSKNVIVIGAHYDTYDGLPGADDNASGVAGLLELARLLEDTELDAHILLAAYALEEPPSFRTEDMGSFHHAKWLYENDYTVTIMISLEMIAYFSNEKGSQSFPVDSMKYFYPDTGNFIGIVSDFSNHGVSKKLKAAMMENGDLPVYSINAPSFVPGIDFSDHMSFWTFGFPALMITDTAFYRNPHYHEESDTLETLDLEKAAIVVQSLFYSLPVFVD